MANSLMELYGGGMVGNRTNYQLGGRVAASRRGRDYRKEIRRLNEAAEEAQRKQSRASSLGNILGTIGGIAGSLIPIPGVGTAVGTALGSAAGAGLGRLAGESTYQGTKVEGGKYAQDSRRNLQGSIDDFKSSMGERALAQGLRSGLGSFISAGGIGETKDFLARKYGIDPGGRFASKVTQQGLTDNPFLATEGLEELTDEQLLDFLPDNPLPTPARPDVAMDFGDLSIDTVSDMTLDTIPDITSRTPLTDINYDDLIQYGTFQGPSMDFMPAMRGGGMVNMMPQYQNGGMIGETKEDMRAENERRRRAGLPVQTFGDAQMQQRQQAQAQSVQAAPYVPGYGTATDLRGALGQLGMTDLMYDPRFDEFAGDLPQFSMGYAQQIGDIYSGAQQAARGMRAQQRQAAGQRGFAGSGIGQTQSQQAFGDLQTDVARQRRGVVEGFQADLLSAIGDIEAKGEFEFGSQAGMGQDYIDNRIAEARRLQASQDPNDQQQGNRMIQELEGQGYNIGFLTGG